MIRLLSCLSLALTAAAASTGAQAQSLQELYEAARAYDATFLSARALAASAQDRVAQTEALTRPQLSAAVNATGTRSDVPLFGTIGSTGAQGALNGRLPLFNRFNAVSVEQARRLLLNAQADLDTAEQDLILRISQSYFDVLAAVDTLNTTRASKTAITEQLASARRNFEVGTATITDTREAQARFDLATAQEIAAENDLRAKRIGLDVLVGRQNVEPRPLLVPVLLPGTAPANPEEWVGVADQQHPTVRRARVNLDVARLEVDKARANGLPVVDAVASVSNGDSRGSAVANPGRSTAASVGVQLNWPLYTGGSTQARIRETILLEEKVRNDLEAARRSVAQATRVAYFNVLSGAAQVRALEAAEASTKLALEATQLGYRVGVRVNLDVLNAQTQLFTTQRDLARARYDVVLGGLRLRQASGQLQAGDVQAVNQLLAR